MLQTINNKIQRSFSRSARHYDLFSGLHRETADKIFVKVIKEPEPLALLDVGCGTGYLTAKLRDHFPQSKIVGLDFAQGMLEVAAAKRGGIAWVLADGNQLPFSDGCFDIVVSNLAFQWAGDLSGAFKEARRVLSPGGFLACTLFGHKTCQELLKSLDDANRGALQFDRLPQQAQVREALSISGFKGPHLEAEQIKIEFKNMYELMAWLKSIGANNLPREGHLGRRTISKAALIYRDQFSYLQGVAATFEVIRVYAKK